MNDNTFVRIKVPKALYESALRKALLEAGKEPVAKKSAKGKEPIAGKKAAAVKASKKETGYKKLAEADMTMAGEILTAGSIFLAAIGGAAGIKLAAMNAVKKAAKEKGEPEPTGQALKAAAKQVINSSMNNVDNTLGEGDEEGINEMDGAGEALTAASVLLAAIGGAGVLKAMAINAVKKAAKEKGEPEPTGEALKAAAKKAIGGAVGNVSNTLG